MKKSNIKEIEILKPGEFSLPSSMISEIKKEVIDYILDEIGLAEHILRYYFESSVYDIFRPFIIDQMIFNNHEVLKNGEEILVSHNNENIIDEQDIKDYIDSKPELEKYLKQLIWKFYYDNVDINEMYREAINQVKQDKKEIEDADETYDKWDLKRSVQEASYSFLFYLDDVIDDNNFERFLEKEFLQADLIKENKMNKRILKENQSEQMWHGSGNYFRSFKEAGIGGGSGAQVYGWGLYFAKDPKTAMGYVGVGSNVNKTKTLFQGKSPEELGLEYENEIFFGLPFGLKTAQEYSEWAQETIELLEGDPEDFPGKEDVIKDYKRFIEIIKDLEVEQEPMKYMYRVTLFPNKTPDYLNWNASSTPQSQVDKINQQTQKENLNFQVSTEDTPSQIYRSIIEKYFEKKGSSNAPKDTSKFLVRAGIDGTTHSNGDVRIAFDDKNIEIDKIYKFKEFSDIKESKKSQLNEYSEKVINQMIEKFQKEMRNTLSVDDIKLKLQRFDQIKSNLPNKIKAGIEKTTGGITVPKKFTEPDPRINKVLNPLEIQNYTWKDLEAVLDAYGTKAEKTSKDFATVQDAEFIEVKGVPVVYSGNGLKIYEGSNYEGCVKLNYAFKFKGEDNKIYTYSFCIGRKEEASNQYYTYRFGRGGGFRSFYFVADTTQTADIKGDPSNKKNFVNWYHLFVIHAFDNDKFGVTDAVNQWGSNHELTGNDRGVSWEEIGAFMVKNGGESGKKAWDKIKNLKNIFKYVPPPDEEVEQALVRDQILNFEQFKNLTRNQKRIYITRRADQANAFTSEMFNIVDLDLKNLALRTGTGFKPKYNDIKNNAGLSRSYATFRFSRIKDDVNNNKKPESVLPLPFVKHLTDEEKQKYYDIFSTQDNPYLSFEYVEKYFGEKYVKQYIESKLKELSFLPPQAAKYIDNPKLKRLFELYSKLFVNWQYSPGTNASDEELANSPKAPRQSITPKPITQKDWAKLSSQDRKDLIDLTLKYDGNEDYKYLIYALPFVIQDRGKYYALLPTDESGMDIYDDWVLVDTNNNIVRSNISGETNLNDDELSSGYPGIVSGIYDRVYDIEDLGSPESLDEVIYKALNEFIKTKNY